MTELEKKNELLNLGKEIVIFIGPEGAGKTTIAKHLAAETGKTYLTTGDVLRYLAENDPGELGEKCRVMFSEHTYLDGETLLKIMVQRFAMQDTEGGFILDGGLRTLEETIDFQDVLDAAGRGLPVSVVYLQIPDEISFERLVTGENARKRSDDTEEGVSKRLCMFHNKLEERLAVIENQPGWRLVKIDATRQVELVFEAVKEAICGQGC